MVRFNRRVKEIYICVYTRMEIYDVESRRLSCRAEDGARLLRLSGNLPRKEGGYFFFLDGFFSKIGYVGFLSVERMEARD